MTPGADPDRVAPIVVDAEVVPSAATWSSGDPGARQRFAGEWVADALRDVLAATDTAVLGLVGGSSVEAVYRALATVGDVDWSRVIVTIGDERAVPVGDDQRNWHVIEALTGPLVSSGALPADNLAPLPDVDPAVPDGPARAAAELSARIDHIDVVILSLGPDGHVASLFPGHEALGAAGVFVPVDDSPKPPPRRVSASVATMASVEAALLVAIGDDKQDAARALVHSGPLSEVPGRIVHLARRGVIVSDRPLV